MSRDAFQELSEAVLQIASEVEFEPALHKLVHAVRELVGADYAAIGVPDGRGGFRRFITSGMSDELIAEIGPLPRTHGLLGAMLTDTASFRTDDIRDDPRFEWWPRAHPEMDTFMGVPIVAKGEVLGAFYLTCKDGGFTDDDQRLTEVFAAHAAIAIDNARLFERSRELTVVEERNRLARDLHDSVAQTLFSLNLTAEAALNMDGTDELRKVRDLAREALGQMRSIVFELRPADLAADGLAATLVKHSDVLSRVFGQEIHVNVVSESTLDAETELELFRIAQEALSNALKHARASRIDVTVDLERRRIEVRDDGVGFDPDDQLVRSKHLGLVSMEERAGEIGAALDVATKPGAGTTVSVQLA